MGYLEINHALVFEMMKYLQYDPETGLFTWIKITSKRVKVGDVAGRVSNTGHIGINFMGVRYQAHRLAWAFIHGSVSKDLEVDHIDGDPTNNRLSSIRLATKSENSFNKGKPISNSSGFKGVSFNKFANKWEAYVNCNGIKFYLGLFTTPEEAFEATKSKRKELHGEFSNDRANLIF